MIPGWLAWILAVLITGGLAWWLRRIAARAEEYHEREFKSPSVLDLWSRGSG